MRRRKEMGVNYSSLLFFVSYRCEFVSTWVWAPAEEPVQTQSPAAGLGLRLPGGRQTPHLPHAGEGWHHGGVLGWSPWLQHSRWCASPWWDIYFTFFFVGTLTGVFHTLTLFSSSLIVHPAVKDVNVLLEKERSEGISSPSRDDDSTLLNLRTNSSSIVDENTKSDSGPPEVCLRAESIQPWSSLYSDVCEGQNVINSHWFFPVWLSVLSGEEQILGPLFQRWKEPYWLHPGLQEVQLSVREEGDIWTQHPGRGLTDGKGGQIHLQSTFVLRFCAHWGFFFPLWSI